MASSRRAIRSACLSASRVLRSNGSWPRFLEDAASHSTSSPSPPLTVPRALHRTSPFPGFQETAQPDQSIRKTPTGVESRPSRSFLEAATAEVHSGFRSHSLWCRAASYSEIQASKQTQVLLPQLTRDLSQQARRQQEGSEKEQERGLTSQEEDIFDSITDKIPERPVTVTEGASYSLVILLGLALAGGALYFVVKELILEPKEYKVFNRALARVQKDAQVASYLGSPITGYGQESRNRAARQRISHKVSKDEDGVEKTMVQFHIRGPGGAGIVHCEMFLDAADGNKLKYTYLVVDITNPVPRRLMLESYVPT